MPEGAGVFVCGGGLLLLEAAGAIGAGLGVVGVVVRRGGLGEVGVVAGTLGLVGVVGGP